MNLTPIYYPNEPIKAISLTDLINLLEPITKSTFISMQLFYQYDRVKASIKEPIYKRGLYIGQLNSNYYKKVNKRLASEGKETITTENKKLPKYRQYKDSTCLIEYLSTDKAVGLKMQCEGKKMFKDYYLTSEGKEIEQSDYSTYFAPAQLKKVLAEIPTAEQCGLNQENKFFHFAPKLKHIEFIKIDKQVYKII